MAGFRFSFILVNYQSTHLIQPWLNSLDQTNLASGEYEIIIVNNDTDQEEINLLDTLSKSFSVFVIHLAQNIGFGAAVNRGAARASGTYLFLCNPDTLFVQGDFQQIPRVFAKNPLLGIIGAQLLDAKTQKPELFSAGGHISLWRLLRNHSPWREIPPRRATLVERVSGGALCIPREVFRALTGFDERFFLYFEDADLCQRARQLHRQIFLLPSIQLIHQGGASMPSRKQQKDWYRKSRTYYFQKHRPRFEIWVMNILSRFV